MKIEKKKLRFISGVLVMALALSSGITLGKEKKLKGKLISVSSFESELTNHFLDSFEIQQLVSNLEKNSKKEEIMNNPYPCDTIEKIAKRQEELEALNLQEEDKIYMDCPLSAPLQHFIYEQSAYHKIPFDFLLSAIYVESRGQFNSSGQIGYNSPTSHDLGLTQQNTISSLPNFMKEYNVSYEDGYQLLKDNDYANVCAAFLICEEINKQFDEFDAYEYAGCYNGWLNWKQYSISREYVSMFQDVYDHIYTDHHEIGKKTSAQMLTKK